MFTKLVLMAVTCLAVRQEWDDFQEMEQMTNDLIKNIEDSLTKHHCDIADEREHPALHAECENFRKTRRDLIKNWNQAKKLKELEDAEL